MRKLLLIPLLLLTLAGCGQQRDHAYLKMEPAVFIPSTTTTTIPPTTTTVKPTTTTKKPSPPPERSSRGTPRSTKSTAAPSGGDFWQRLANCESPTNSWSGRYKGYFQFSSTNVWNANNVWGFTYTPEASYEQQKAAAQYLAAHADPHGQWPRCWSKAGGR